MSSQAPDRLQPSGDFDDRYVRHTADAGCDDIKQYVQRGTKQIRGMIEDDAARSVLVAMAAGFGLGLILGKTLGGSSSPSRWTDRVAAEGLGRRMMDKLEHIAPDAISKYLNR